MTEQTALTLHDRHSEILPSRNDWAVMLEMASAFLKSGLLPNGIKTPEAALLIIQKGKELGVQPTYALSSIAIIQGKPVAGSELMLALIYRDHGDNALRVTETTDERCVIDYRRRSWAQTSSFTFAIEDAKRAGLTGKDNWKNYPAAMLRARCISAVARLAFPDTIGGLYTPEEMGAEVQVDAEGRFEITEVTPAAITEPAPAREPYPDRDVPGKGKLLDEAMEALRQLSGVRKTSGKSLVKEWAEQCNVKARDFNLLNSPQLQSLRDWANLEIRTAQTPPSGQRYTPEQLDQMPQDAKDSTAAARATVNEEIAASTARSTDDSVSL